jgi:hypothetical protein
MANRNFSKEKLPIARSDGSPLQVACDRQNQASLKIQYWKGLLRIKEEIQVEYLDQVEGSVRRQFRGGDFKKENEEQTSRKF